jgi:hypothetical protein
MTWSTASPSTRRTESVRAGPGAAGAAPGPAFARALLRRAEIPPHFRLPFRTWLFAPACGLLVALCAVLAAWHGPSRPGLAGIDLRAAPACPNVDNNSASAAGAGSPSPPRQPLDTPRGAPAEPDQPRVIIGPLGGQQSAEPPLSAPAMADDGLPPLPPAPPPPKAHESRLDPHRGDSTMLRLMTIRLPFALAAVLAAQPLTAGDVEKPVTLEQTAKDVKELKEAQKKAADEVLQQLRAIQDQLKGMEGVRKDVDALRGTIQNVTRELELSAQMHNRNGGDLTELRGQVKQLHDDLDRARAHAGKLEQELTNQAARCDALTRDLAALRRQASDGSRQSARLADTSGTIRLYNTFGAPITVVVNGRAYRLEPGETHTLSSQPLGAITYEVLGIQPPRTVTLTAERPLDIEVFDQSRGPVRTPLRPVI